MTQHGSTWLSYPAEAGAGFEPATNVVILAFAENSWPTRVGGTLRDLNPLVTRCSPAGIRLSLEASRAQGAHGEGLQLSGRCGPCLPVVQKNGAYFF